MSPGRAGPVSILISEFWLPEQWSDEFLLFKLHVLGSFCFQQHYPTNTSVLSHLDCHKLFSIVCLTSSNRAVRILLHVASQIMSFFSSKLSGGFLFKNKGQSLYKDLHSVCPPLFWPPNSSLPILFWLPTYSLQEDQVLSHMSAFVQVVSSQYFSPKCLCSSLFLSLCADVIFVRKLVLTHLKMQSLPIVYSVLFNLLYSVLFFHRAFHLTLNRNYTYFLLSVFPY